MDSIIGSIEEAVEDLPDEKSISLEELATFENLPQSLVLLCYRSGFPSLQAILDYQKSHGEFLNLKDCGKKSNEVLQKLCAKYSDQVVKVAVEQRHCELRRKEQLILDSIKDIELQDLAEFEGMSTVSYNACSLSGLTSLKKILRYYYNNKRYGFINLRHCSTVTSRELIKICIKSEARVNSFQAESPGENASISFIESFPGYHKLLLTDIEKIKEFNNGFHHIPIFKIIDFLIEHRYLFSKEKHYKIFKATFYCYQPMIHYSLKEVGKQVGLTNETVRLTREIIYKRLIQIFRFLSARCELRVPYYYKSDNQPIIFISDEEAKRINYYENTYFSPLFMTFILSEILSDKFARLGDLKVLFSNASLLKSCVVKNLYLINREIQAQFQFRPLLKYLDSLTKAERNKTKTLSYSKLITKFKVGNKVNDQAIIDCIKTIVSNDYRHFFRVRSTTINLLPNKSKTITASIIEVLAKNEQPMHYAVVYQKLVNRGVNVKSKTSTRSLLSSNKRRFENKSMGIYALRS
jgi:hypothetical protein